MGESRIDPRQQFSKWLARWTAVFWFVYTIYVTTFLIIEPVVANVVVYLVSIVSVVMIVNVAAYTQNSLQEKVILAAMQNDKIKIALPKLDKIAVEPKETSSGSNNEPDDDEVIDESDDEESGEG